MNPLPPHQLLSAYLDGELSAREREEVERLLERSPEARQELLELEQVGMLLRQLPREALPQSFAPQVLDACLSDTAIFGSATPPPANAHPKSVPSESPADRKPARERDRSWLRFTSVAIAASALGLIALLSWPEPEGANRETIAQKSPRTADPEETFSPPPRDTDDNVEMRLAGDDANAVDALNNVRVSQQGQTESAKKQGEVSEVQSAAITMAADAVTGVGPGGANRKTHDLGNKELKDLPAGELVEAFGPQGEQVAVVKLVVADRKQGLKNLRQLLQKHRIAHEPSPESDNGQVDPGASDPNDEAQLSAVYVETNQDQLAYVIEDLQKAETFQKLTMEAPVETAQFDFYLRSPDANLNEESQRRVMRFSGAGGGGVPGPKAFQRNVEAMKADAPPKPSPEPAPPNKSEPDKSSPKAMRAQPPAPSDPAKNGANAPDEPAAQTKPSAAGFGAENADPLRESENAAPLGDRSANEAKRPSRDKEAVPSNAKPAKALSTQRDLTLSPEDLMDLQKQLAPMESQEPEAAQRQRASVGRSGAAKPVQVLFVLVNPADATETASPTPAANAPARAD